MYVKFSKNTIVNPNGASNSFNKMEKLSKLSNIGTTLEKKLIDIDIKTLEELKKLGSKEAFIKIKAIDNTACYNMLCALEGAIQGIRWHYLSETTKQDLKYFFESLK